MNAYEWVNLSFDSRSVSHLVAVARPRKSYVYSLCGLVHGIPKSALGKKMCKKCVQVEAKLARAKTRLLARYEQHP